MQDSLLAFYDRQGPADIFLDSILLALGLTPLTEGDLSWNDQPSMQLMPSTWQQLLAGRIFLPMGAGVNSHYSRQWDGEHWLQTGKHQRALLLAQSLLATTTVSIEPHLGCKTISLRNETVSLEATLLEVGQKADAGIPAWKIETNSEQESINHE